MEITEEQFRAFVRVRDSGLTNMWDAGNVEALIESFDDLAKRFQVGGR